MTQLQRLTVTDAPELFEATQRSRDMLEPWITPRDTLAGVVEYLSQTAEDRVSFAVRAPDGGLAGIININAIIRGAFHNGFLGYYALEPYEGQGLMFEGMALVIDRAFGELGLHRLEANIQPANTRSAALVRRLGFRLEGHSPRYLKIGDEWRDHDRYAITAEEWQEARGSKGE